MTLHDPTLQDETEVRDALETWASAVRNKDAVAAARHYAPDIVAYDVAPPLRRRGALALRGDLDDWFATFRGPVGYELRDVHVTAGADVAFAHGLVHLTGDRTGGERTDVWMRSTACLRRTDGGWKIVHEHTSVPFHMDGSLRAAVDLQP